MIRLFVQRRITTAMIFLAICLLGFISLSRLPVELLPDIELPGLTVITPMHGASPSEVEKLVTVRIEESLASVSGLAGMVSESIEGLSIVKGTFQWGTNMDMALIEAKEKADLVKGELPGDAGKSVVVKYDPSAEPVMIYSIFMAGGSHVSLRSRVEKEIVPYIERISGVALADVAGGEKREIRVEIDNRALYSHNLSIHEVMFSIESSNYSYPAGTIIKEGMEYLVRTSGEFRNLEDIRSVAVGYSDGGIPVYLSSIASVSDTFREKNCEVRFNGSEAVALLIKKEPGKNTVETCSLVREAVESLSEKYRGEFVFSLISDQSRFIEDAIRNVIISGLLGGIIAFFVLWFFLKSIVPPLIIATTIPVSVTGTLFLMHSAGISINSMSLGGLALGIGMMVDSGIVVLESVSSVRERSPGISPEEGASSGAGDVVAPLAASILTSVVVFVPLVFLSGLAGALFRDLALTVSLALLFSLFTSLTLIPMLAGLLPGFMAGSGSKRVSSVTGFYRTSDRVVSRLTSFYGEALSFCMGRSSAVIAAGGAALAAGFVLMLVPDREIVPSLDPGEFIIYVEMPGGSTLEQTLVMCRDFERALLSTHGVRDVFVKGGADRDDSIADKISGRGADFAEIRVFVCEKSGGSSREIIQGVKERFRPGERIRVSYHIPGDITASMFSLSGNSMAVEIRGGIEGELADAGVRVKEFMEGFPGAVRVWSVFDSKAPEVVLEIDRVRAGSMGLSIEGAASAVSAAVKGEAVSRFREDDDEIDIRVRLRGEDRSSPDSLRKIIVKTGSGAAVMLSEFSSIREGSGSVRIVRKDQGRINMVTGEFEKGFLPGHRSVEAGLKRLGFREGISASVSGDAEGVRDTLMSMLYVMCLALVFVYMLLASQFQSLADPLIIMLSIPLTALGIALSLILTGESININSGIGMIMLCGIVVNNAIVLFDYIEKERKGGLAIADAVIEAGKRRLKPILMTTLTTVFALLPIALAPGRGAELQRPLAVTVIGGLLFSTVLTLIFIPVVYSAVKKGGKDLC